MRSPNVFRLILCSLALMSCQSPANAYQTKKPPSISQIPSQYKPYAMALGHRMQRPGRERIAASGTVTYRDGTTEHSGPIDIIWEYPLKVRLNQNGTEVVFDRDNADLLVLPTRDIAEAVQVLLEDSIEGFLGLRKKDGTSHYLGSGYWLQNSAGKSACMDVVQLAYPDIFHGGSTVAKTYLFNCQTKLLGLISYTSPSGSQINVVVDDWREIEGEKLPFLVERWEDGEMTMRITLDSAGFSAGAEDGTFGGN